MNDLLPFIVLPLIALTAFYLKALTGFGPAIVVISIGSLFFPPHPIIATSAVLDLIAGVLLFQGAGAKDEPKFLTGLVVSMILGTILGAALISVIPVAIYKTCLGGAILALSIWFIFFRNASSHQLLRSELPSQCDGSDLGFSFFAGICGGLFGISGPPIIWHLGRRYNKEAFRAILITVFVVAAVARIASYYVAGMFGREVILYVLVSLPGLALGLFLGNKSFLKISEQRFSVTVGFILFAISLKLITS